MLGVSLERMIKTKVFAFVGEVLSLAFTSSVGTTFNFVKTPKALVQAFYER